MPSPYTDLTGIISLNYRSLFSSDPKYSGSIDLTPNGANSWANGLIQFAWDSGTSQYLLSNGVVNQPVTVRDVPDFFSIGLGLYLWNQQNKYDVYLSRKLTIVTASPVILGVAPLGWLDEPLKPVLPQFMMGD